MDETTVPSTPETDDISNLSYFQSVKRVLSNRNWTIYLMTVWIYGSMAILHQYFNLYFRDIGVSYILTGALISLMFFINLLGTFVAGYLADNYDRRKLSVVTMVVGGTGFIMISLTTDVVLIALAMLVFGLSALTGAAGRAYHMQQVDRRLAGIANSLFTLGTSLGLAPLLLIVVMFETGFTFVAIMQTLFFIAGILYYIAALVRATILTSLPFEKREVQRENLLKDFLSENVRGLRLLLRIFPTFIAIVCIDAFSDSFYRFVSPFFVNETLNFGIPEINLMFLVILISSIPIAMYLGRIFDKRGGKRLTLIVYSVMPIAVLLLILAQYVPYVAPPEWLAAADGIFPGLSVIFSLAFIATAMKQTNDILWYSVLGIYIMKSLPRPDLGKMLSLTDVIVLLFISIGPIPAGIIYTYFQGLPLLYTVLFLNIFILIMLATRSIEPRISVEELENEANMEIHSEQQNQ
jgi:MFS family permease